jgi:hypothetical protein
MAQQQAYWQVAAQARRLAAGPVVRQVQKPDNKVVPALVSAPGPAVPPLPTMMCPSCGRRATWEVLIVDSKEGRRSFSHWKCACSWSYVQGRPRYTGAGADLGCEEGHRFSWSVTRQVGARRDLACRALGDAGGKVRCDARVSVGGKGQGFLRPGGVRQPWLRTKLSVLAGFEPAGDWTTLGSLRRKLPGLTTGQIQGALSRAMLGKSPSVARSADRLPMIPCGSAFGYSLTARGVGAVRWAVSSGLVIETSALDGPEPSPVVARSVGSGGNDSSLSEIPKRSYPYGESTGPVY